MRERLQKIIAAAGLMARRKAEEAIRAGRVTVNGVPASLGESADPETDEICLDGKPLPKEETKRTVLLYKPRGAVTTLSDEKGQRRCVNALSRLGFSWSDIKSVLSEYTETEEY